MDKIPSTTLLTLPDGSRIELRLVPAGADVDPPVTSEVRKHLDALKAILTNLDGAIYITHRAIEDVVIDTDDVTREVTHAVERACETLEIENKDDALSEVGTALERSGEAQVALNALCALLVPDAAPTGA